MKSAPKRPEAKADSAPQVDDVTLFIETLGNLFPRVLQSYNIEQSFNPIRAFGMTGPIDVMGGVSCTINLRFVGAFDDMLKVRDFMKDFAHNINIHEQCRADGTVIVTADFIVSGAALRHNRKLYDAHFDMLIEEELSKKPE